VRGVSPPGDTSKTLTRTLVVSGGVALLASACGGSPGAGVAQVSSTTTGTDTATGSSSDDPVAYSACMRSHGFPDFPDPESRPGGVVVLPVEPPGIDPDSPQVKAAQRTCQKLLPDGRTPRAGQQAKEQEERLKFARCMRSHGVTKFPDPMLTPDGGTGRRCRGTLAGSGPPSRHAGSWCRGCAGVAVGRLAPRRRLRRHRKGPGVATVGAGGTTTAAQSGTGSGLR
jgi:hypothetical protein